MSALEITQGDYGNALTVVIEDEDLSSYTAKIYIWKTASDETRTKVIDGKSCTVTFVTPDTHISYIPASGDFADVASGPYEGLIRLSKTGVENRTKYFNLIVFEKEPS